MPIDGGMLTPRATRGPLTGVLDEVADDRSSRFLGEKESKAVDASPIPRGGPRWSDLCDNSDDDEKLEDEGIQASTDEVAPKSPSKSARRANRRRRCREAARAAAEAAEAADAEMESEVAEQAMRLGGTAAHSPVRLSSVHGSPQAKTMLPAGAFVNRNFMSGAGFPPGNCTPICLASPAPALPSGAFTQPPLAVHQSACSSPVRGVMSVMSTSPSPFSTFGDASTRTPTAAPQPFPQDRFSVSDASVRTPVAGVSFVAWPPQQGKQWGVASSPCARTAGQTVANIVSTSPMGSATKASDVGPSAGTTGAGAGGATGNSAADTIRSILGQQGLCSGEELEARLRAAAPETYED